MKPAKVLVFVLLGGCCAAQIVAPPWDILSRRPLSTNGGTQWLLTSTGGVYTGNGYAGPNPPITATYGDSANSSNVYWRQDAAGKVSFSVRIGGIVSTTSMAVDADGNLFITGEADPRGFVPTSGAYKTTPRPYPGPPGTYLPGLGDTSFVCKLRAADGAPVYCTYLDTLLNSPRLAVDSAGAVTVLGGTRGAITTTPGALNQGSQAFAAFKLDPAGARLLYAAAFGSVIGEIASVRLDPTGGLLFGGSEYGAPMENMPAPPSFEGPAMVDRTGFVGRLQPDGAALTFWTRMGSNLLVGGLARAPSGNFVVIGSDQSGAGYLREFAADGATVLFAHRLDAGSYSAVAYDASGNIVAVGHSAAADLPVSHNLHFCRDGGFIARFAPGGSLLERSWLPDATLSTLDSTATWAVGADYAAHAGDNSYNLALFQLGPVASDARQPALACVTSAAAITAPLVAPGEIIRIFGTQLAAPADAAPTTQGRLPTTLGGVSITFDGVPAPMLRTAPDSITAIAPFALATSGTARMCLMAAGAEMDCVPARLAATMPSIVRDRDGLAVLNEDGSRNSASNPAAPGSILSFWATGLGALQPAPVDGSTLTAPLPALMNTAVVTFLGFPSTPSEPAVLVYAGPAPSVVAGVYQINVRIPSAAWPGVGRLDLTAKAGDVYGPFDSVAIFVGPKP